LIYKAHNSDETIYTAIYTATLNHCNDIEVGWLEILDIQNFQKHFKTIALTIIFA